MALANSELEQVLDVVQHVCQAQSRDEFLSLTLGGVLALVPCMVVAANEVDPTVGRFVWWHEPSSFAFPANTAQLLGQLGDENPLLRHLLTTGDGSAWRVSDLATTEQFHATRLYQQLYGPMGMEYQMSVTLPAPAPMVFAVVLGNGERDFSDRDRRVMNTLRPHVAQAWRNVRDHERLRALVGAAQDIASMQGWGVIVLCEPPEELVPGALVSLYRYFGRPSKTSPFPARVERWLAAQSAQHTVGAGLELARPLSAHLGGRRYLLRYLPAQRAHPGAIIVSEGTPAQGRDLELLGLSPREAQVVALVTAGVANAAIAERLGLAPGTVRKHLDNVYGKLGVHGRGPLTAFVLNISGR
jgi:DNA-binding CsgD family transcriptional regulator